jgi:UDP-glucose 4-epimerase
VRTQRALVTGAAGFLGSTLSEHLVDAGVQVVGVDCFTDYYARHLKEANLQRLRDEPGFSFTEVDLAEDPLEELFDGVDVVYHLAAQAGVRGSFGETFSIYVRNNVHATQRVFEAAAGRGVPRVVYASSSSIYGNAEAFPTRESATPMPVSPYGMTKVATEQLAGVYHRTRGLSTVGLRYFTVYGPRQRPDMAFTRFIARILEGRPITVFGDGGQIRDFTYVDDIVAGTVAAGESGIAGRAYNLGGGHPVALRDVIALIGELLELPVETTHRPASLGDARRTGCDTSLARSELGYRPRFALQDGLAAQIEWCSRMADRSAALLDN